MQIQSKPKEYQATGHNNFQKKRGLTCQCKINVKCPMTYIVVNIFGCALVCHILGNAAGRDIKDGCDALPISRLAS
jgi:hypothetical protein